MAGIKACLGSEVSEGAAVIAVIKDKEIGIIRHAGKLYAYLNVCPHQGGPACEGVRMARVRDRIDEGGNYLGQTYEDGSLNIICPWHGYEFDVTSGDHVGGSGRRLRKYGVQEKDGVVYVDVDN